MIRYVSFHDFRVHGISITASVMMWSVAVAVVLVTLVALNAQPFGQFGQMVECSFTN